MDTTRERWESGAWVWVSTRPRVMAMPENMPQTTTPGSSAHSGQMQCASTASTIPRPNRLAISARPGLAQG